MINTPVNTAANQPIAKVWRKPRWLSHTGLFIGGGIVLVVLIAAVLAPILAPYDPYAQALVGRFTPPIWHANGTWAHPLGMDHLGRDYLSRIIYGAQISLAIGVGTALVSGFIGTTIGVCAGYFGGRVDSVMMFIITARLALPVVLVALAVVALAGSSFTIVLLTLGLLLWDRFALVSRATTIQLRSAEFVTAAELQGASLWQLVFHQILPNLMNSIVIVATLEMAQAMILEAALSFLGLGVPSPLPSWGLMISEGKSSILFEPWLITIPGAFLFALVLGTNLLGDGLRDVLSPSGRN
ncbi:ABC transporter permease [Brucella anthropi]|uniref:ABC transporter permease n=1 Tax=Brucella anthropi TaxID=529 RepID=UPI00216504D8|nr:ABC transporter permease [Brucella anthropi]MDG9793485.1 ABC transporter permease [Brucella anthropi]MDH0583272.1 ABC transporter permease [Brucella anthropi]MDH0819886.1 ABC transporter permease [Brucella anthropi]MDH2086589.1 ABC transporter permease [Brucella anthropi]UVV70870.1 ABC transporter permease [Brucella anthropi]